MKIFIFHDSNQDQTPKKVWQGEKHDQADGHKPTKKNENKKPAAKVKKKH